jgi:cell wall-associated NlpC family hydrolase
VIVILREGAKVRMRGAERSGWQPIMCAHTKGWVASEFVEIGDGGSPPAPPSDPGPNSDLRAGDSAVVANTNGEGLRLRSRASSGSSIITVMAEGTKVEVRRGSTGDWVAVTYRTSNGFVHMDYLRKVTDEAPQPDPGSGLGRGDHAELIDDMNFRSTPSLSGSIITTIPEGTVVLVTGPRENGFYPVEAAGFAGYLHGDYLKRTEKDLSDGSDDNVGGQPGDGAMTPQGRKMIEYAQRFLGYPYVWATHGPDTFDCSGFTYYVTIKTLKLDIGAGTWSQSISGTPVAYGDLRPGDLVFFQNTFTWGLSHVGIYIGDGKFIHAENERTGVVISSLTSTYYKTRWYGARRVTTD